MKRIGFACAWEKNAEGTWSGTSWRLRNALRRRADVIDVGVEHSATQTLFKYLYVRRRHGNWKSVYRWSRLHDWTVQKKLRASQPKKPVDAVVETGDFARFDVPFYIYKDISFAVVEKYYDPVLGAPNFTGMDLNTLKRRKERQHQLWESAAGIFAMSEWIADALVESSDVPREKVFVVYAGANCDGAPAEECIEPEVGVTRREPPKLLFVGRDFFRKGGDLVVRALAQLRQEYRPDIQLTVVGPNRWPLPGNIPEGVVFLESRTTAEVAQLYREHDLLVMPSRFEPFGIVFIEALSQGVPVVGRASCAMPELIRPGENGALVVNDDPAELASKIVAVLENPAIWRSTAQAAKSVRAKYSWDAVAERMLHVMAGSSIGKRPYDAAGRT